MTVGAQTVRPEGRFHPLMRLLHWLTALLVLAVLAAGLWLVYFDPGDGPFKHALYVVHESTGMLVWLVVLLRVAVRLAIGAPALPAATPRAVRLLAAANHAALYAVLLTQPLIGLTDANAWGAPLHWYGLFTVPWFVGRSPEPVARAWDALHWWGAATLLVLLALHVAGAAYHALLRQDGVVRRMV